MSKIIRSILTAIILACAAFYLPMVWAHSLSWLLLPVWTAAFASGIAAIWYRLESRAAARRLSRVAAVAFLLNIAGFVLLLYALQELSVWTRIICWLPFFIGMLAGFLPRYEHRFLIPFDEKEHYAAYQDEIDALQQAYQLALVDQYGFHASYVREKHVLQKTPYVIRGHYDEKTADDLARATFNNYYRGRDANNPAIFARHMVTDKPLPTDYPYDSLLQKIGKTPAQQAMRIVIITIGVSAYYSVVISSFVVGEGWGYGCIVWSVLFAAFMTLWLKYSSAPGRGGIHPATPFTPTHYMQDLWVFPSLAAASWLLSISGIAVLGNALIGDTQERTYSYHMGVNTRACLPYILYVDGPVFAGSGKICVKKDVFRTAPRRGLIKVTGKASWFGIRIDDYELGTGAQPDNK